jgi:rhodanese-related sulfurtransferase
MAAIVPPEDGPFSEASLTATEADSVDDAELVKMLMQPKVSPTTLGILKAKADKDIKSLKASEFIQQINNNSEFCVVDVRSESEYNRGHIPNSFSLPLLSDQERHTVGLCFSKNGFGPAMGTGMRFVKSKLDTFRDKLIEFSEQATARAVAGASSSSSSSSSDTSGATKKARVERPQIGVYCFRGRMRSRCISWWFQQVWVLCYIYKHEYISLLLCTCLAFLCMCVWILCIIYNTHSLKQ